MPGRAGAIKKQPTTSGPWTRPPVNRAGARQPRFLNVLQDSGQSLTPRELEVVGYIAEGLSNPEIAKILFLAPETIKSHVRNLSAKLGARNRTQAAVIAYRTGLLSIHSPAPLKDLSDQSPKMSGRE